MDRRDVIKREIRAAQLRQWILDKWVENQKKNAYTYADKCKERK